MKRLVVLVMLALPASAHAETATVVMPGKSFSPARVTVVAGDSVLWRNADLVAHDVRGPDFTSGPLASSGFFTHAFAAVGAEPFVCSIHPFMTGEVDVVAATLSGASAYAGETVELKGRVPAGTASVAVERQAGDAWLPAATARPAADGAFAATVRPDATAVFRARTAAGESPAATVAVTERIDVRIRVSGHAVRVTARKGLVATLQVYSRERFAWRGAGHVKLDARGRGTIMHHGPRTGRARVVISRALHGPALAVSEAVRLRDGRHIGGPPESHAHHHMD